MNNQYFTKSAFKLAMECPTKLFYCCDNSYANQDVDNDFLQALAKGGYQVGELAKIYYHIQPEADIKELDYNTPLQKTKALFQQDHVNIAEAAFCYKNLFVRADIIEKKGNHINLIEVKAKSWNPETDNFMAGRGNKVNTGIQAYVYDVAFQKYVITHALQELYPNKNYEVHAYLMMADKSKVAPVEGINQQFIIVEEGKRKFRIEREAGAEALANVEHVLTPFDVNYICDNIINDRITQPDSFGNKHFEVFVNEMAYAYCKKIRLSAPLKTACKNCPFFVKDEKGKKDGRKECWMREAHLSEEEYSKPLILELWGGGDKKQAGKLLRAGNYLLENVSAENLEVERANDDRSRKPNKFPGLHSRERKLLQIGLATNDRSKLTLFEDKLNGDVFLDKEGLKAEMQKWDKTLHFIDFETSASALPFYKGMKPYESVAFQFSHHKVVVHADGTYTINHEGQYINAEKGVFPNFGFLRTLKSQLEKDNGTIFRYATHENTILRHIRRHLEESDEKDKEELIAFIDDITQVKDENGNYLKGKRNMVDMAELVKDYFYSKSMKGSNSIKQVLPAVLNASQFLHEKYSQPIYGSEIPSLNIDASNPIAWISINDNIVEPYKQLPKVNEYLDLSDEEISAFASQASDNEGDEFTVAEGGAAMTAYSKLQFSNTTMSEALVKALYRYCELDTMAMVFIWEYFYHECFPEKIT